MCVKSRTKAFSLNSQQQMKLLQFSMPSEWWVVMASIVVCDGVEASDEDIVHTINWKLQLNVALFATPLALNGWVLALRLKLYKL